MTTNDGIGKFQRVEMHTPNGPTAYLTFTTIPIVVLIVIIIL
jgi:hypothetical protein